MTADRRGTTPGIADDSAPRRTRRWWWIPTAVVLALSAYLIAARAQGQQGGPAQAGAPGRAASAAARAVPVVTAPVRIDDLPVYLNGLGNVTASQTVVVRTRVDGQLVRVNYREGQLVRQGDLLAEIDPRPFQVQLMEAEGQRAKDEASLKNANLDLARYQALVEGDAIPRQQLDTQRSTVNQFEGALREDQGQVEAAKLNLTYTRITAPLTGRVGLRQVDAGNMVHAADPNGLVVITQVEPIAVIFTIAEDALLAVLARTRSGQHLTVEAWNRDFSQKLGVGTLLSADNSVDQSTGTVKLKALFDNKDDALFPNQFVNARLLVDTLRRAVVVPTAAIQRGAQSTFVWVAGRNGTAELRPITVVRTEGDLAAVSSGVSPGEAVVVDGVDRLQQGTKVVDAAATRRAPGQGQSR